MNQNFWQQIITGESWQRLLLATGIFSLVVIIGLVVYFLLGKSVGRLVKKSSSVVDDLIFERVMKPIIPIFIVIGIFMGKSIIDLPANINQMIEKILIAVLLFLLFQMLILSLRHLTDYWIERVGRRTDISADKREEIQRLGKQVKELVFPVVGVLGGLTILSNLGLDLKLLWTSLGVGGIAVALAVKEPLSNFVGRLYIYATGIFDEGHFITFEGWSGTVKRIGYFRTYMELFADMTTVSIPNTKFMTGEVKNYYGRRQFIYKWDLDIPYDTDRQQIQKLIEELKTFLFARPEVVRESCWIYLDRLDSYSKVVRVWFKVTLPDWAASLNYGNDILYEIQGIFARQGVDFAFPTQVVSLEDGRLVKNTAASYPLMPYDSCPETAGGTATSKTQQADNGDKRKHISR
jgi:MscS family membrane protein